MKKAALLIFAVMITVLLIDHYLISNVQNLNSTSIHERSRSNSPDAQAEAGAETDPSHPGQQSAMTRERIANTRNISTATGPSQKRPLVDGASEPKRTHSIGVEDFSAEKVKQIILSQMPGIDLVTEELKTTKHAVMPKSILKFAKTVNGFYMDSNTSESKSEILANVLKDCAIGPKTRVPNSVRAFCIKQVMRLVKKHPKLQLILDDIERNTPKLAWQYASF